MCDICYRYPCAHGCPNEEEAKPVEKCSECGESIVDGENYYEIDDEIICLNCLGEWADQFKRTAKEKFDEPDYD